MATKVIDVVNQLKEQLGDEMQIAEMSLDISHGIMDASCDVIGGKVRFERKPEPVAKKATSEHEPAKERYKYDFSKATTNSAVDIKIAGRRIVSLTPKQSQLVSWLFQILNRPLTRLEIEQIGNDLDGIPIAFSTLDTAVDGFAMVAFGPDDKFERI